jgi:hypothetical protein
MEFFFKLPFAIHPRIPDRVTRAIPRRKTGPDSTIRRPRAKPPVSHLSHNSDDPAVEVETLYRLKIQS